MRTSDHCEDALEVLVAAFHALLDRRLRDLDQANLLATTPKDPFVHVVHSDNLHIKEIVVRVNIFDRIDKDRQVIMPWNEDSRRCYLMPIGNEVFAQFFEIRNQGQVGITPTCY